MGNYISKFNTIADFEAAQSSLDRPHVSLTKDNYEVYYNPLVKVTGVSLNKSELSLNKGDSETLVATVLPSNANNKSVTWSSSDDSVATVSQSGVITAVNTGSTNITVTTVNGGYTAQCSATITPPMVDGHEYVEIGGKKWATMNIGATSETDYGLYFQWGDTQGYTAAQVSSGAKRFSFSSYLYSNGGSSSNSMTKYNSADNKITLNTSDDAAQAIWGNKWKMPTYKDFASLRNAVTYDYTNNYNNSGVAGLILTDKNDKSKKLFFPYCGSYDGIDNYNVNTKASYWTSSLSSSDKTSGRVNIASNSDKYFRESYNYRNIGVPIRPIVA